MRKQVGWEIIGRTVNLVAARIMFWAALAGAVCPCAQAATLNVTSTLDGGSAGTLRTVLAGAANGDTITFDTNGVFATPQTIVLTSGELLVANSVTILGPGPNQLAINGGGTNRVFHVGSGLTVTIASLTITNGFADDAVVANAIGGGIFSENSTLAVTNCIISGNRSGTAGGGICNSQGGTLTVVNSTLSGNHGGYSGGGGILNSWRGMLTVVNSTLSGNSVGSYGGGIWNAGVATISNSMLSGNTCGVGGGIYNNTEGTLTVVNSTLSGNSVSDRGGGIANITDQFGTTATLQVINSTLSGNSANHVGGGILNQRNGGGYPDLYVLNSTLNGNSATNGGGAICNLDNLYGTVQIGSTIFNVGSLGGTISNASSGTITSLGYNLASDNGGGVLTNATDQINTDPLLGLLQDNGGPTFTHAPLCGSPAIDKGTNCSASATDQRGAPRTFDDPNVANATGVAA